LREEYFFTEGFMENFAFIDLFFLTVILRKSMKMIAVAIFVQTNK